MPMTLLHSNMTHPDGVMRCMYCAKPVAEQQLGEPCDGPLPLRAELGRWRDAARAAVEGIQGGNLDRSTLEVRSEAMTPLKSMLSPYAHGQQTVSPSIPEPATGGAGESRRRATALRQTIEYLKEQDGVTHKGYFSGGWAGSQLAELLADLEAAPASPAIPDRPEIVCLCGSTRFYGEFQRANYRLTMEGKIVLSVGFYPHAESSKSAHGEDVGCTPEQKTKLDELHKRKIDLADRVLVLNCLRPRCSACGHWQTVRMSNDGLSNCCMKPLVDEPYIGDSTRSEIEHAAKRGKPIDYLNAHAPASPAIPDEQQPATRPAVD